MMLFSTDPASGITSPLDLDSLFYWYAADVGVTDSVGSPIENNDGVGQWNDLSGNGRHLASSLESSITWCNTCGPGSMPAMQKALPLEGRLAEIDSSYWSSNEVTFFVVGKVANATANVNEAWALRGKEPSGNQFRFIAGNAGFSYREFFQMSADGSVLTQDIFTPKSTNWRIICHVIVANTDTSNLYINGVNQTRNTNATQSAIYAGWGKLYSLFGFTGSNQSISEVIVFSRALTTGERTAIENYLNKKYDLF
jgi:hypothetical protein